MKTRFILLLIGFFVLQAAEVTAQVSARQGTAASTSARAPYNPLPFQNNLVSPSAPILFLLSERGTQLVGASNHPNLRGLLSGWGVSLPKPTPSIPARSRQAAPAAATATMPCSASVGAQFNLEGQNGSAEIGFPVPQNEVSVDYIPGSGRAGADLVVEGANDYRGVFDSFAVIPPGTTTPPPDAWGFSLTGYYVHRAGTDCSSTFEGGLPHITYAPTGEILYGGGDPAIAVDATRGLVYAADLRFGATVTGIGLEKTTAANLNNSQVCPNGTHLTDSSGLDTAASLCWPVRTLINAQAAVSGLGGPLVFSDKPHVRVDDRALGTGAGDVYISWSFFDLIQGTSMVQMAACPASFASAADCSSPMTVSGGDTQTQFSHLAVRPDGVLTLTYINVNAVPIPMFPFISQVFDIKYLSCQPQGAPRPPVCSQPSLVTTENQPLPFGGFLAADIFRVSTYPTHDQRLNGNTFEEFVVWSRCKAAPFFPFPYFFQSFCADADLVMTWSATDSAGNPAGWAPVSSVNSSAHDQLMPWVRTDRSRNIVNIAYYSSQNDPFGHRLQVLRSHIDPGAYAASSDVTLLTTTLDDPAADFLFVGGFIGDYIGIVARGEGKSSRAYFGFTSEYFQGFLNGNLVSNENNALGRLDY